MGEFRYVGTDVLKAKGLGALVVATNQAANDLVGEAQADTPVDTGTLRASIHTDGAKVSGYTVRARVQTGGEANQYAIVVHEGSGPHTITASHAKALSFNGIVVKSVHHPGTPAFKYIERPLIRNRAVYLAHIQAAARGAF